MKNPGNFSIGQFEQAAEMYWRQLNGEELPELKVTDKRQQRVRILMGLIGSYLQEFAPAEVKFRAFEPFPKAQVCKGNYVFGYHQLARALRAYATSETLVDTSLDALKANGIGSTLGGYLYRPFVYLNSPYPGPAAVEDMGNNGWLPVG